MKRKEERINESKDFRRYRFDRSDNYEGDIEDVFVKGAEWADETTMLKAEEWFYNTLNSLNNHGFEVNNIEEFIADFRKAIFE